MGSFLRQSRSSRNIPRQRGLQLARRSGSQLPGLETLEHRWLMSGDPVANTAELAAEQTAGDSINAFGMDLYAQLQSTQGGNLIDSPFSIATALAMAYAGARGETATQMASVLHLTQDPAALASAFGALLTDLNAAGQAGGYTLSVADALWAQQGFPFVAEYLNLLQSNYQGGLNQVDFNNATEAARQEINDWVSQQTNGKITDLFPPGSLKPETVLALTNAIYMNAKWSVPFEAGRTSDASFTLASGGQVSAPTMHNTDTFRYMQRDGFQVLELPYGDGRLAMDILLPTGNDGLSGLDVNRLPADLNGWFSGLSEQEVAVSLPKFKLTSGFGLVDALSALGMTDAFTRGVADFTGIGPNGLYIDAAMHKAFIAVDESSTEAAATTGIGVVALCQFVPPIDPIVFNADHPFLFMIRDTKTGSLLFTGQIEDPTQQGSDPSAPTITHQAKVQDPGPIETTTPPNNDLTATPPITLLPVSPPNNLLPVTPPIVNPRPPVQIEPIGPEPISPPAKTLTPNQQFVTAAYQRLLNRDVDSEALTHWSNVLDQGGSRESVTQQIENSDEFRRVEVQSLYQQYLGRGADTAGLDFFAAQLAAGESNEQVSAELVGSNEYLQAHGGTNASFLDALFAAALGRAVDADSQAYFAEQLAAGTTRQQIAAQIFASDEYQHVLAGALFSKYLHRPADAAGIDHFASELHGGLSDELAIAELVASQEFFTQQQV